MKDYSKYYNLEKYLTEEVSKKFSKQGYLDAFDFFCIVIWKANRAKSKIAKRICELSTKKNIKDGCKELTTGIRKKDNKQERLNYLLNHWQFRLPMASAILTILYPKDFTVYDVRVCRELSKYKGLYSKSNNRIIEDYFDFVEDVKRLVQEYSSLRDKDRYLWGKSFSKDLNNDIGHDFIKNNCGR
ncbi:hypothetical protein COX95_02345 [bacterium CG_4_10_14_0_2_um_filter_33_32]|nr:MAG: hypothetical protein AUJ93_02990 [bacterium CG2_30_33_46]PIR67881.1 MAG: hypothetical protein COU50_00920 [bacterium CG10_big_fil_rev_8_21_14_0_10_33_18]PIU76730.1 MAG: hypothetical protein COS74_02480 [bacterium CG06_land_8_20_14_3_00_33_50]PIW81320.1 MAG: hypothetical protein COZ97_02360 [bacterium CG_4_8_14_3_um_filter_33_28]PIY85194.1 MAG: hypothetical protein COY76_03395 [bacterium CG_4_10_14_0_8_um_filter_33_57]PIZ86049.1 MAG: hypothetical protein COX95_02345 [bacterium CG_4_10_1